MMHNYLLIYPLAQSLLIVFFCAFLSFVLVAPAFIKYLKRIQKKGQPIRSNGPKTHLAEKKGTPTMGGLLILFIFSFYTLCFSNLSDFLTFPILSITILFGLIGFADDYLKITKENSVGLRGKTKLLMQFSVVFSILTLVFTNNPLHFDTSLYIPIFDKVIELGGFYIILAAFVIVGTANAVNITDGLDGLVSVPLILAFSYFIIEIWCISQFGEAISFSNVTYFQLFNVAILLVIIVACLTAFLCFNSNPAQVFMGDSGSLALGALLGTVAVVLNHELILLILGMLFVLEAISVMIQVGYFKLSGGKRLFKMAPIHHHFELMGWSETQVVTRFWVASFIFFLITFVIVG